MNIIKKATVYILILAFLLPAGVSGHLDEPKEPWQRVIDPVELLSVELLSDVRDWWDIPIGGSANIAMFFTVSHSGHPPVVTRKFTGHSNWVHDIGVVTLENEPQRPFLFVHEECTPPEDFIVTAYLFEFDGDAAAVATAFNIVSTAALASWSLATGGGIVGPGIAALFGVTLATGGAIALGAIAVAGIAKQLLINQMDILNLGSATITFNPDSAFKIHRFVTRGEGPVEGARITLGTRANKFDDPKCRKKRPHPEVPVPPPSPPKEPTTPTPTPTPTSQPTPPTPTQPSSPPTPTPAPVTLPPTLSPKIPELKVLAPESLVPKALKIVHYANKKLEGIKEGDKVAFGVRMVMSDGSEREMLKGKVTWQVVGLIGSITSEGAFTAKLDESIAESGEGLGSIVATYKDASGASFLGKTPIFKVEAYYGEPTGPQEGKLPGENFLGLLLKNLRFWK